MALVWLIATGFVIGLLAKFVMPGENKPRGFVLTALLGIAGSFVGTFLGQFVGYLRPAEQGNFVTAVIGAVAVLAVWGLVSKRMRAKA
jgi:uncharacterized membrane protein YeaQ/YmgE (transglycosylase-associated protein family)